MGASVAGPRKQIAHELEEDVERRGSIAVSLISIAKSCTNLVPSLPLTSGGEAPVPEAGPKPAPASP